MIDDDGVAMVVDEKEKAQLGSGSSQRVIHCVPKPFFGTAAIAKPMSM
jgi:hypothetical protein